MKLFSAITITVGLVLGTMVSRAQSVDAPQILHVTTWAGPTPQPDSTTSPGVKAGLVVLSLSSAELFDHFERDVEGFKKRYLGGKLIVAVDRDGGSEKGEFMLDFYRLSLGKNSKDGYREAFDEALKNIRAKYGEIHFKVAMYDLTEQSTK